MRSIFLHCIIFLFLYNNTSSQNIDNNSFKINTRLSFYSAEDSGEVLLHIPRKFIYSNIEVTLHINNDTIALWKGRAGKTLTRIPFALDRPAACYNMLAKITVAGSQTIFTAESKLIILGHKHNEVKTDRLTGGLIVNKRTFFPFGFYCYSPVYPTLPEEEVVKGFNMISPYQKIIPATFNERKSYMDRCASLGMKVHYNLLSVSGGGGVGSQIEGLSAEQKMLRLIDEIIAFMDHPALLAWYIADEPNGYKVAPDSLIQIYNLIKNIDPWHPVSIVFMAPFLSSKRYIDAMDIVMADPYPIPGSPLSMVGDVASSLSSEFNGKRPLWIVPQAFGGGEWWMREPTIQEIRAMTYQSIIKGAKGIQYFVRQGLNLFPKSTSTWAECGRMAVEIAELTPWLLSDENSIPVRSGSQNIIVTSSIHDGQLMIMAANRSNFPQRADYTVARAISGRAKVLFENRSISVSGGIFSDYLPALGTQVYMIDLVLRKDSIKAWKDNLVIDPGFEDNSSPGVPASCYAWNNGDRGATYFTDTREHVEGNHSLRLITPEDNRSIRLRFFPFLVRPGATYYISVQAKADTEQQSTEKGSGKSQYFQLSLGDYGSSKFPLSSEWQKFGTIITIPDDIDLPPRSNVILQMPSAGIGWFDMLQVLECYDIKYSVNPELRFSWED